MSEEYAEEHPGTTVAEERTELEPVTPLVAEEHMHFEADGHPDGYAVASGTPGVSGRWVTGATREEAVANWEALFLTGELTEHAEPDA